MALDAPPSEKSHVFKPLRFEPLYQQYFGFWLGAWSRCGRIEQKIFFVPTLLGITYVSTSIVSSAAVGICARYRPKHLKANWVYFV